MIEENPLQAWLASLTGNLLATTPEDTANKASLLEHLQIALPPDVKLAQSRLPAFAFEKLSPAAITELHPEVKAQIDKIITERGANISNDLKVFQRESPVRSPIASRSVPTWAGGAAVEKTIGPFINLDGRRVWFDFFKVEKLVALYETGAAMPSILFNVDVRKLWSDQNTALLAPTQQHYTLTNNSSVWISSQILGAGAPAGKYTGLTITSGTIDLSALPTVVGNKTTITPATLVTVKLKLKQQQVTDADATSPYGTDARAAEFTLPDTLEFQFNAAGGKFNVVGNAHWKLFGHQNTFKYNNGKGAYNPTFIEVLIPLVVNEPTFKIEQSLSPFANLTGEGKIVSGFWALPTADLDLAHITPAAGIGGLGIICDKGLSLTWAGLQQGNINLNLCIVAAQPGIVAVASGVAANIYARQSFELWLDNKNPHASKVKIAFGKQFKLQFFSTANGYEVIEANVNAIIEADRPIDVAAKPLPIHTKDSVYALAAYKNHRSVLLYDNNLVADNYQPPANAKDLQVPTIALALRNALFTTSTINGCFLAGDADSEWKKINTGTLYLSLAIYKYIPMLPDPYAANVSIFQKFVDYQVTDTVKFHIPIMSLLCLTKWGITGNNSLDDVDASFHLLPFNANQNMQSNSLIGLQNAQSTAGADVQSHPTMFNDVAAAEMRTATTKRTPEWSSAVEQYFHDDFALLDVSSHANQMGISFGSFVGRSGAMTLFKEFGVETKDEQPQSLYSVPFKIDNVEMMSPSLFTRSFALPQIAWEPVHNLTPKHVDGDPPDGMNFYPDDGGATRLFNNSFQYVPLAPKPVIKDLIRRYKEDKNNVTWSFFTLPFGMKALAIMSKHKQAPQPPSIESNRPIFNNNLRGGIQIQCNAGYLSSDKFPVFNGATIQLANVLDANGNLVGSTLGRSVADIFNKEFKPKSPLITSRGVPLTRIDFSGYGASIFNNWANPFAEIAQTSQTKFDVFVGRTAHEVVQVKSIFYPWGIHVVRTIVLYRTNTGYVYRVDTGWQAESDGLFNFTYHILTNPADDKATPQPSHYKIHPGVVKGLFNIKNIVEINETPFKTNTQIKNGDWYLDDNNNAVHNTTGSDIVKAASLQKITFDADVEIEGVIQGHVKGRVASKQVVGYVQLAPMGVPLSSKAFTELVTFAGGSIGGPVDCIVDINASSQRMRLNRIDVSNESSINTNDVFVAAARGSAILPKDGSWSMVTHQASSGEVSPLPENITVPLIRVGQLVMTGTEGDVALDTDPTKKLLRIANPTEILRAPTLNTINYGFLQNTGTQKALFLTPAFQNDVKQLLSKTPPLFSDAYRMMSSKSIFPNIGDAISDFKDAIPLDINKFSAGALKDGADTVFQLMKVASNVTDAAGKLQDQAYKLLKNVENFDLPSGNWKLIDEDFLKIYIEYKTTPPGGATTAGKLNFDIDSLAGNMADKWKSRLNNLAMVVDLGSFDRLMIIKGNFDAKKGSESNYEGGDATLPTAVIEFSPVLQTVIDLLQILQDVSGGEYKDALKKGLKIAMSNNAGTWEYKFEAAKEIPVVKFPFGLLYNDPEQPLKLEASMKIGVYFNAALMVTTDPKKLLPTAGAFIDFYGQITVMCVSLAAATVYAVGQVTLGIAADTAKGPSLDMKFGFGAQLVVGLPVVGNVSVLYMVGIEVYLDSKDIRVTAFMLFKGHAELLGGIVGITITIEAKGTIDRHNDRTDCSAQVTFAIDISIFLIIDIDFSTSWEESRQVA